MDAFFDVLRGNSGNSDSTPKAKMKNLWFDITTIAHPSNTPERSAMVAKRIRQIGVDRILYGTDAAFGSNLKPRESWAELTKIGLTAQELKTIASNRPPYMP
jgi:predicted TIM-barrel fold metal-dependent hydrolase